MKLTIIETGLVPEPLSDQFPSYPDMFGAMFERDGVHFDYNVISIPHGEKVPTASDCEAILITGSSAGVYEDHGWLESLRAFIRDAYTARIKMVGICFGHQIIADALGGKVEKSDRGWGLGRHTYQVAPSRPYFEFPRASLNIACSHQDQVVDKPESARVVLRSDFAPNAGLLYANGATLTVQPHPEFSDDYARALIELREDKASADVIAKARSSLCTPSDSPLLVRAISKFLQN